MVDNYLIKCKEFRVKNVIPAEASEKKDAFYLELNSLAQQIVYEDGLKAFASMLYEGHYLIPLWTAHIIIENNYEEYLQESIKVIRKYSENPLAPDIALKEAQWLQNQPS